MFFFFCVRSPFKNSAACEKLVSFAHLPKFWTAGLFSAASNSPGVGICDARITSGEKYQNRLCSAVRKPTMKSVNTHMRRRMSCRERQHTSNGCVSTLEESCPIEHNNRSRQSLLWRTSSVSFLKSRDKTPC